MKRRKIWLVFFVLMVALYNCVEVFSESPCITPNFLSETEKKVATIQPTREIIFVDQRVPDRDCLLADFTSQADQGRRYAIIALDATRDGIEQVSKALINQTQLNAIHFLTHGLDGAVQLGGTELDSDTIRKHAGLIKSWGKAFTEDGDILFYGCNLAATEGGQALVETLSMLTGADVAASNDKTGHASLCADWDLEFRTGRIEAPLLVSLPKQGEWHHLLNIYDVTNTNDAGAGSLRQAIIDANGNAGADTITFSIGAAGSAQTINVLSALPVITGAVTIDGWTQGGVGYTGPPLIELNGAATVGAHGLDIQDPADGTTIRGLVINRFGVDGIQVRANAVNISIVGNYIGTDATGMLAGFGNGDDGIDLNPGSTAVIGGTTAADRNVISGNSDEGVIIETDGTIVQGNYIGTQADGIGALGNSSDGIRIYLASSNNLIGGTAAGAGNIIANSGALGIRIDDIAALNNSILHNSIYNNSSPGIDLGATGVTNNDSGDGDSGANYLQNYPVIDSAVFSGSWVTISGHFNNTDGSRTRANSTYNIDFFANPAAATGREGRTYLGSFSVTTDASGDATFISGPLDFTGYVAGDRVTATATMTASTGGFDAEIGSTSEFSASYVTTAGAGSLLTHWPFDEGAGQTANDVSGNGNDGTLGTTAGADPQDPTWACGNDAALNFDGGNDGGDDEVRLSSVTIGDRAAWTISAWIKMGPDNADQRTIYSEGNTTQTEYLFLYVDDTGSQVKFYQRDPTGLIWSLIDGTTNVENNAWHLVTMVQRSKTDRELYVDKVSQGTDNQDVGTPSFDTASIGYLRTDWVADPFLGLIDDVRIYDYALTSAEISALYASPPEAGCGPIPAVTSAVAEIAPNDVLTGSTANTFSYDIAVTIGAGDSGVDRVAITVPATFGTPTVTDVQVGGASVAYTDNTSGNDISVDLTVKVAASDRITVLFDADAPGTQDLTGVDFLSTVDDSATVDALQATTEGNGDGDGTDGDSWTVTTTDPSGNVLLIVSNAGSPDASDQALKTYLESNGLTVFYADDDDADYNPAISANNIDVVYVSTSAGSSAVGDKTRDLTVGVVQANGGNWDNQLLHCSGSNTQTPGTDVNLIDNSHYITQPFATGVFAAYSSTGSLNWGDDLGTGAQVLIQMDGQPTQGALVVYDTNSELCDTSLAPARRVGIYTDDVFSLWTATTQTLVLRSLLWAGGTGGAGGGASLTLADHASGQVSDRLNFTSPITDTLFQFELTRSGTVTVDNVRVNFTTGGGVANSDVSGGELWEDTNGNGSFDVGDALIEGALTPVTGVLTFTADFTPATTGTTYFVRATVANLAGGDTTTFSLGTADIDEVEGGVTESGSITNATHTQDASLQINYRSIGTAADYNANTVTATNGSPVVDGSGTAWQTANRGQGDRITIDGGEYTILSVDSQTQLTLARPFTGIGGAGKAYSIARHFTTLTEWEDCISFAGCPALYPFPPSSASLVADNRQEIGIAYNDSVFTERLIIDGSTTDATRNITLTVASGNRHNGTAGTGVVLDPAAAGDALIVQDDYTRIEWLEVTGWPGSSDDGVLIDAELTSYAYMIVHDGGDGDSDGFRLKENSGNWTATVRNSIAYNMGRACFHAENWQGTATLVWNLENVTAYNCGGGGTGSTRTGGISASQVAGSTTVINATNVLSVGNIDDDGDGDADFNVGGSGSPSWGTSSFNMSTDTTAPGASSQTGRLAANQFVNITPGSENLHLKAGADAINTGTTLGGFSDDIDLDTRPIAGVWEIGADETSAAGGSPAVTSAVAEISPNDVTTGSTGNAFSYDIAVTIGGGDTGVNRVAITVPGTFGAPTVTDVQVGGGSVAYTNNTVGNTISVDLAAPVGASNRITVLFDADAPGTQDLIGVDFTSTVDDSGTAVAPQATTEGNGDGDAGDANSWTVTTTDSGGGGGCIAVDNVSTNSGTGLTLTISHNTSGTERLMIVVPQWNSGGSVNKNVTSVTYNSIPLIRQDGINQDDDAAIDIWTLVDPPTGTYDVVITYDVAPNFEHIGGVITLTGVDQTTPFGSVVLNNETAAGTTATATVVVPSAADELVFAGVAAETPGAVTWQGSLPEQWHLSVGGNATVGAGATEPGAAPNVTMQWTDVNDHWVAAGISIKPSASCGANAVTSAVAEISPNDVTTGSTGNSFSYDIQATIGGGDSGVDRVAITVPATFGAPTVTDVQVGGVPVAYTDNTAGNAISVDLAAKVAVSNRITVLFDADAPGTQDLIGVDFTSTVDDSGTAVGPQATTEGNGDGDAGDNNSWTVTTTDGSGGCPIDVSVSADSDDLEEYVATGAIDWTSTDLELGDENGSAGGGAAQIVGLRFAGLGIPQGATITNAYIQFTVNEADSVATNLTFRGELTGNAATFANVNNSVSSRVPQTTASVSWNNVPAWNNPGDAGLDQRTPNLAPIIEEIVSQGTWSSGNALVILVTGTGERTAWSHNGAPASAPLLHVECSGSATPAVTSAVAEISPNDVTTGSTGNSFSYDIQVTIGGGDSGVDRVAITVPGTFGAPTVTDVQVGGASVAYTDNTSGNDISVDLTVKVISSDRITVLFDVDAPGIQDLIGQDFLSTVDDSGTADAPQATTEGNGDGDAGDANFWTVTTTDPPPGAVWP